jgi:hypothetical protein
MAIRIPSVPTSIPSWDATAIVNLENPANPYGNLLAASENKIQVPINSLDNYTYAAIRIISASNSSNPLIPRQFSTPYYFAPYIPGKDYVEMPAHLFLSSSKLGSKTGTWTLGSTIINVEMSDGLLKVGMPIIGSGIAPGTVIVSIDTDGDKITISTPTLLAKSTSTSFDYFKSLDYSNINSILGYNQYYKIQVKLLNVSNTISFDSNGKWSRIGSTLTGITYTGNGTTTVTANLNGHTLKINQSIIISGATGTEQPKLNGTWLIKTVSTNSFTFVINSTLAAGTYSSGIGTAKSADIITTQWLEDTVTNGNISPWSQDALGRPILIKRFDSQNKAVIGIQDWLSRNSDGSLNTTNIIDSEIYSFNGIFEETNERIQSYRITIHYNNNLVPPIPLSSYEFESSPTTFFSNYINPSIEWINSKILSNNGQYYITFEYTTESGYSETIRYKAQTSYSTNPLGLTFEAINDNENGRLEILIEGTQVRFRGSFNSEYIWIPDESQSTKIKVQTGSIENRNAMNWNPEYRSWGIHSIVSGLYSSITKTAGTSNPNPYLININSVDGLEIGMSVSGTGITRKTKIVEIDSVNNLITINIAKSGSVTGTLTFTKGINRIPQTITDFEENYIFKLASDSLFTYYVIPVYFIDKEKATGGLINKVYNDFYFIKVALNQNTNSLKTTNFFSNINDNFNRSKTFGQINQISSSIAYLRNKSFQLDTYSQISSNNTYEIYFGEQLGKQFLYVKDLTNNKVDRLHT